ncbi:MAG: hypothetical protein HUU56_04125 [Bdellovibrionaceae bacterium]|nr:hypothetical protein [Pseudobdellovibrionaceae bacterium]
MNQIFKFIILSVSVLVLNKTKALAQSAACLSKYTSMDFKKLSADKNSINVEDLVTKFIGVIVSVDMSPLTQESLLKAHLKLERSISTSEIESILKDLNNQDPQEKNFGKKVDFVNDELEKLNKMLIEFGKGEVPWQKRINKQKYLDEKKKSILESFNGIKIILNILKSANLTTSMKDLNARYDYFSEQEKILENNLSFIDNFTVSVADKLQQYPHLAAKLSSSLNILSTTRIMLDSNIRLIQNVKSLIASKLRNIATVKSLVENEQEFSYLTILIQNGVYFSNIEEKLNEISKSQKGLVVNNRLPIVASDYNNVSTAKVRGFEVNTVSSLEQRDLGKFSLANNSTKFNPSNSRKEHLSEVRKETQLDGEASKNILEQNTIEKELEHFLNANKIWIPEQNLKQLIKTEYQLEAVKLICSRLGKSSGVLENIFTIVGSFKSEYSYKALKTSFLDEFSSKWGDEMSANFFTKYQHGIIQMVKEVIAPIKSQEELDNFSIIVRTSLNSTEFDQVYSLLMRKSKLMEALTRLNLKTNDENLSFEEFRDKVLSLKMSFIKTSKQLIKAYNYENRPILKFVFMDKETKKLTLDELKTKQINEFNAILDLFLNIKRNSTYMTEEMSKLVKDLLNMPLDLWKAPEWNRKNIDILKSIYMEIVLYKLSNFDINSMDNFKRFADIVKFHFDLKTFGPSEIEIDRDLEPYILKVIYQKISIFHDRVLKSKYTDIEGELLKNNSDYSALIMKMLFKKANELFVNEFVALDSKDREIFISNYKPFKGSGASRSYGYFYNEKNENVLRSLRN